MLGDLAIALFGDSGSGVASNRSVAVFLASIGELGCWGRELSVVLMYYGGLLSHRLTMAPVLTNT